MGYLFDQLEVRDSLSGYIRLFNKLYSVSVQ